MSQVLKFNCSMCQMSFSKKKSLETHLKKHCLECQQLFSSVTKLRQHDKTHAGTSSKLTKNRNKKDSASKKFCDKCNMYLNKSQYAYHLRTNKHKANCDAIVVDENLTLTINDFNEKLERYTLNNSREELLFPEEFFKDAECTVVKLLNSSLIKHITFKFNFEIICDYVKMNEDNMIAATMAHISKMKIMTRADDLQDMYWNTCQEICVKMSEFQERDSGWTLVTIRNLNININQFCITKGSQYITTPSSLKRKRACLNIKNNDVFCFKWCIIAALYPGENLSDDEKELVSSYNILNINEDEITVGSLLLNFKNLIFPLSLKDIKRFETNNDISINVFGYQNENICGPYYLTSLEKINHISLILLTDENKSHFVLITDISR